MDESLTSNPLEGKEDFGAARTQLGKFARRSRELNWAPPQLLFDPRTSNRLCAVRTPLAASPANVGRPA
jgi:hypothetical protein